MDKEMVINKVLRLLERRKNYHQAQFNRYSSECEIIDNMNYVSKRNKSRREYSYSWMCRHLEVLDELRLIEEKIKWYVKQGEKK